MGQSSCRLAPLAPWDQSGGRGLAGILFQHLREAFSGQGRRPGEFKTWCLKYNGSLKHCIFPKGKGNGCQELRSSKLLRSWEREETSLGVAKADDEGERVLWPVSHWMAWSWGNEMTFIVQEAYSGRDVFGPYYSRKSTGSWIRGL